MNICFYAPIKNEERYIRKFVEYHMEQMTNGDMFCFVDTGSTDKTKEIMNELIQQYPVYFFDDYPKEHPFSFDFIRNYALDKVPSNIDIGIVLDIDEFFLGKDWRQKIENIFTENPNAMLVHKRYEDLSEEQGEGKYFIHDRCSIHSINKKIRWKYPVHECLSSTDKKTKTITVDSLISCHLRNQQKERPSYKGIITEYMKTRHKGYTKADIMHLHYIWGNEYFVAKDYDTAIPIYKKYLKMTEQFDYNQMTKAFRNNTASVCIKMAIMFKTKKDLQRELIYRHLAIAVRPCRETYLMLAMMYIDLQKYDYANHFYEMGINITDKNLSYTVLPAYWDEKVLIDMKTVIDDGLKK